MLIKENRKFTLISAVLLLLLLVSWAGSYMGLSIYFDMCDEPYQIMCGWDYRSSVAAPLSAWLTSVLGPLWNFDYWPFRTFGWTMQSVALLIGMVPVWQLSRNINFTLGAGAISMFLFSICRSLEWMYNWDSNAVPVLMTVVALCFNYSYSNNRAMWKIVAMGVLCSILTMLRLPSATAIVVPVTCILFTEGRSKIGRLAILFAVYGICVLTILLALYGSVGEYRSMLATNLITAHSSTDLWNLYVNQLPLLYLHGLAAACVFFLISKFRLDRMRVVGALAVTVAIAIGFYLFLRSGMEERTWGYVSPLFIATEAYIVWKARGKMRLGAVMALMTTIFGGLGSNVMIVRVIVFPIMPIVIYYLARTISQKTTAAAFAALWIPMLEIAREDTASQYAERDLCPIQPAPERLHGVPHMQGMRIGWWELDRIQRIADRFMPFVNDTTYNTAVMRNFFDDYMFEYMFDSRSPVYAHYWDYDPLMLKKDYTDSFTRWVESSDKPTAVLMVRYTKTVSEPEEAIIREYKSRYNTVYSDSDFTIVIVPPQITSMPESRR